ncbi:uncharacterized protein LOC103700727 [Phoenix dactylifera]|uniref:Uncharacterized protein LOC103700727 n=1 Tax=Phoenix dactylifera TaxID=42345 RepID=A0A8B7BL75_PHODC|nr:uncharacterized protein LOC103700727 [Phoenix dactylifera]
MVQNTDERQAFCGTSIGLAFLTTNTVLSAYRARHDPWTVAFVLFAYLDLLALFGCLRAYEKQRAEPLGTVEMNTSLKVAIWVLANALNVAFAYRVAQMMPLALYAVVWGMSGFTLLVTFYGLFLCPEPENLKNNDTEEVLFSEFSPETKV